MFSQTNLLQQLRNYTTGSYIDKYKYILFYSGFCSGFSVIWLYTMWLSFQEKGDKERDDIEWFYSCLEKINTWDGKSTLTEKDQNIFNYFLQHLIFFQKISEYLTISQGELNQYVEDTKGRKLSKEFSIAGLFTFENFKKLLGKILIKENRLIYVSSHNHTTAIIKQQDKYHFYDPNCSYGNNKISIIVNSLEELSKKIFEANHFMSLCGMGKHPRL